MLVCGVANTDDIVLTAPPSHAMRRMLSSCDSFAAYFTIVFNAKKSKCLICDPTRKVGIFVNQKPIFYMDGNAIEINQWPHLSHTKDTRSDDSADISFMRNTMVRQIKTVLCYFKQLVLCQTKVT